MPFTLAHGAAALPFRRFRLVPSALVIGTFAPDFEYFLRLGAYGRFGHTVIGAFVFTLPIALLVLWLFHAFVKMPVARLLPAGLQQRLSNQLQKFRFGGTGRFVLIVASLLAGISTHLLWDSFTHRGSWVYDRWPFLRETIAVPGLGLMPYYRILQHGSTLIGMAVLAIWFAWWYRTTAPASHVPERPRSTARFWTVLGTIALIATAAGVVRVLAGNEIPLRLPDMKRFVGDFICTAIAFVWWQLVAYGMVVSRVGRE